MERRYLRALLTLTWKPHPLCYLGIAVTLLHLRRIMICPQACFLGQGQEAVNPKSEREETGAELGKGVGLWGAGKVCWGRVLGGQGRPGENPPSAEQTRTVRCNP